MERIELRGTHGKGKFVFVDPEDLQLVSQYKWYLSSTGYAVTTVHLSGSKKTGVKQCAFSMHRLIMGFPTGQVDHCNRDRLDNRRENLRQATHSQNCQNTQKKNASGYVGVRQESPNVFSASVRKKVVGYFRSVEEAAKARDIAALKEFGDFAILNFPKEFLAGGVTPLPPRNSGVRTSTTVGVSYSSTRKALARWRAVCRKTHLGWFYTEKQAIEALQRYRHESQIG